MAHYRKNKTSIQEDIVKLVFIFVAFLFLLNPDKTITAFKAVIYSVISLFIIVVFASFFLKNRGQRKTNVFNKQEKRTNSVEKPYYQTNYDFHHKTKQEEKSVWAQPKSKKESSEQCEPHDNRATIEDSNSNQAEKRITWTIEFLKSIEWKLFEELCMNYLKLKGYNAELTCLGADDGIDIKIYDKDSPNSLYAVVQCKSYTSYSIGVKLVRELYGVMNDKNVDIGIFITTSKFTSEAKKFAKGKEIQLINGQDLIDRINNLGASQSSELYIQSTVGDYTIPSCPKCGDKMTMRTNRKDSDQKFWGCQNYPQCRSTMRCSKEQKNSY